MSRTGPSLLTGERSFAGVAGAVAISAGLIALLWLAVPWDRARELFRAPSPAALLAAATAIALGHVATGFRIQTMLPPLPRVALRDGVLVSLWHGLAMIVLPARLGELALVEGLSRYASVRRGAGLAVLVVQRLYDALFVGLFFAVGAYGTMLGGGSIALVVAGIAAVLVLSSRLEAILAWIERRSGALRSATGLRVQSLLRDLREGAAACSARGTTVLAVGALFFWISELAVMWLLFRAFDTSLAASTTLFLTAGLALVYAIPVPTIGGLGLAEGGLAALLVAAGWPADAAIGLGLSARVTLLLLHGLVVVGLLPLLTLGRRTV